MTSVAMPSAVPKGILMQADDRGDDGHDASPLGALEQAPSGDGAHDGAKNDHRQDKVNRGARNQSGNMCCFRPGAEIAGEEAVREMQRGESRQEGEPPKDEPQDAEMRIFPA